MTSQKPPFRFTGRSIAAVSALAIACIAFSSMAAQARPVVVRGAPFSPAYADAITAAHAKLLQISTDPFHNAAAQHKTEVESDNFSFGNTMVATFQVGRFPDSNAGSTDIGWSTTSDGGKTWMHGYLPGITTLSPLAAPQYQRVTDPAIAYDAKHGVWMIVSLPYGTFRSVTTYLVPIVSRSSDGLTWQNPVHVAPDNGDFMDKPWIACDDATMSKFYGHCYVEYIDVNLGEVLMMSTSTDGGVTWSTPSRSADSAGGNGGQPIVQPNGTVLVPFLGFSGIETVNSKDGGKTWQASVLVASANEQPMPGGLRDPGPLPSADVDAGGNAYVAWADCSFRSGCLENDVVFSSSSDGTHWSAPSRVPTSSRSSTQTDWMPGFGIDHATAGSSAHVGVTYYYVSNAGCNSSTTCKVYAGYISSTNGGTTWNHPLQLAGPMQPAWMPQSDLGHMLGDYLSTSFVNGLGRSSIPIALAPKNGKFRQATYTTAMGLPPLRDRIQLSTFGERPVARLPRRPIPVME
ncbi:MAG: exo-alpha-sialidase [Candidatus Eremiobacteraeota bacterium]|nr:exo-alpha-sialidase [Candidatus Eremiobacteraeota bacterium]MBV9646417.1 exo-alpha-sialidase [Candidatus Eremiobacteraeota bacterium]